MALRVPARPILFDVHVNAEPPSFEILFLAELDSDHRVADVPFKEMPQSDGNDFAHALSELGALSAGEIDRLRQKARLIDRTKL